MPVILIESAEDARNAAPPPHSQNGGRPPDSSRPCEKLRPCPARAAAGPHPPTASQRAAAGGCMRSTFTRNAHMSAVSSIVFETGLPAPWPAAVSMRIRTGASPAWHS